MPFAVTPTALENEAARRRALQQLFGTSVDAARQATDVIGKANQMQLQEREQDRLTEQAKLNSQIANVRLRLLAQSEDREAAEQARKAKEAEEKQRQASILRLTTPLASGQPVTPDLEAVAARIPGASYEDVEASFLAQQQAKAQELREEQAKRSKEAADLQLKQTGLEEDLRMGKAQRFKIGEDVKRGKEESSRKKLESLMGAGKKTGLGAGGKLDTRTQQRMRMIPLAKNLLGEIDKSVEKMNQATGGEFGGPIEAIGRKATGYVPGLNERERAEALANMEALNTMVFTIAGREDAPAESENKRLEHLFLQEKDTPEQRAGKQQAIRTMLEIQEDIIAGTVGPEAMDFFVQQTNPSPQESLGDDISAGDEAFR